MLNYSLSKIKFPRLGTKEREENIKKFQNEGTIVPMKLYIYQKFWGGGY